MTRGFVGVSSAASSCAGFATGETVEWITLESDPLGAWVTVAPNTSTFPRSARVSIAGIPLEITQLGRVVPPEVNLLQNSHFHVDLAHWGWPSRFPNGTGSAAWTPLDANSSIASGSMRLRDDIDSGPSYQQLQCVNLEPGFYDYGFTVRAGSREAVQPVIAFVSFEGKECTGNYPPYQAQTFRVADAGVWEQHSYVGVLGGAYQSVAIIVGGWARQAGVQEVWIDDVFLRPR